MGFGADRPGQGLDAGLASPHPRGLAGRSVLSAAWPLLRAAEVAAQREAAGGQGCLRFFATQHHSTAYDTLGAGRAFQALGRTGFAGDLCEP